MRSDKFFGLLSILCISLIIFPVQAAEPPSIATIAGNITFGSNLLSRFMHFVCMVMGAGFFIMAFMQYRAHRDNPKFVPLGRPIMYLVLALVLFSIPFLGEIFGASTSSGKDLEKSKNKNVYYNDIDAPLKTEDFGH